MSGSFATQLENALGPRQGVILDDRRLPLFKLGARVRDGERSCGWRATVVDEELLGQGAPADVMLEVVALPPDVAPLVVARSLESCLIDHPRIQLVHSVALPVALLGQVQPAEPSPLLPPLHSLPLADEARAVVLVKEWLESVPLLKWRQSRGAALSLSDILDLTDTTTESFAALHRRGYAHGAAVPESIALQELASPVLEGEEPQSVWVPKLLDLGLTRMLAAPGSWPSGQAALWCAPEAFHPDQATDWRRVDQLALAAILYALWTDQVPFDAMAPGTQPAEARELRRRQIEALPPPRGNPRARALGVTPAMSAACMRAMSADAADRFPSVDAFSQTLRRATRENARKVQADEDTGPGTLPGTYSSAKFRSLTQPPPARDGALPAASEPQPKPKAAPLVVRRDPVAPAAAPAFEKQTHRPDAQAEAAGQGRVVEIKEPPRPRLTQILPSPGEDDGDYPLHPDEEERREARGDTSKLPAPPPSSWAFNNLAALLLGLWLVTLALLLLRAGSATPPSATNRDPPLHQLTKTGAENGP